MNECPSMKARVLLAILVRESKVLCRDVGLGEEEALKLL
jgi:hypothetical protein